MEGSVKKKKTEREKGNKWGDVYGTGRKARYSPREPQWVKVSFEFGPREPPGGALGLAPHSRCYRW